MENTPDRPGTRLLYIDNIRLFVIICVVMHHLAVTYSGEGRFYYVETAQMGALSTLWFTFYLSFQQAYFMGLMFLLAGYFTAGSYDRKGFGGFLRDRFLRLMVPTLIYMLLITPLIEYVELGNRAAGSDPVTPASILTGFLSSTGVMWFAAALFIFSAVYALARKLGRGSDAAPARGNAADAAGSKLSPAGLFALIGVISVCAFAIRLFQPIGTAILNMQLCYFASYIILFVCGIRAYRRGCFSRVGYRAGKRWLISGAALGFPFWFALVVVLVKTGNSTAPEGGLNVFSLIYAVWESFTAVAVSAGLIGVFKERFNGRNKLVKAMSDSSFAVYMFHPVIIVAAALLFKPAALPPFVKWAVMCPVCVALCFAAAHYILRRIPLLKEVL